MVNQLYIYYKKGTSLVELIAVIVIMGIIAGIAIPTTIAVIARQRRNAALKSAQNIVDTAKTFLLAVAAEGNGDPNVTNVTSGTDTSTAVVGYKVSSVQLKTAGELEKDPVTGGTLEITLTLNGNVFSVSTADITIDGQTLHWVYDTASATSGPGKFVSGSGANA